MEDVLIVGIVFYTLYKIIEIAVLQKERRLMISRMHEVSPEMMKTNLSSLQTAQSNKFQNNPFLMLRMGALSLGVGIGWILGSAIYENRRSFTTENISRNPTCLAMICLCAGIALIVVYIIEQKAIKEAKKGK